MPSDPWIYACKTVASRERINQQLTLFKNNKSTSNQASRKECKGYLNINHLLLPPAIARFWPFFSNTGILFKSHNSSPRPPLRLRLDLPAIALHPLPLHNTLEPRINHFTHQNENRRESRRNGTSPANTFSLLVFLVFVIVWGGINEETYKYHIPC